MSKIGFNYTTKAISDSWALLCSLFIDHEDKINNRLLDDQVPFVFVDFR